ncbi:uncharacterized protein [Diadema setosum]|uniref:uncharacterized protein n=1 Tax=Diadema setosum TaxID=31175 RepID=UPI003B3A8273
MESQTKSEKRLRRSDDENWRSQPNSKNSSTNLVPHTSSSITKTNNPRSTQYHRNCSSFGILDRTSGHAHQVRNLNKSSGTWTKSKTPAYAIRNERKYQKPRTSKGFQKGYRTDVNLSWRKRTLLEIPSIGSPCLDSVGESGGKTQPQATLVADETSANEPDLNSPGEVELIENNGRFKLMDTTYEQSEGFDFASKIFQSEKTKVTGSNEFSSGKSSESTGSSNMKKTSKQSQKLLQGLIDKRKKEYLGYLPPFQPRLYSYGFDNKKSQQPRKTELSKKAEDEMFRKRAIFMMHMKEQEKRKKDDENTVAQNKTTPMDASVVKDVSRTLKESIGMNRSEVVTSACNHYESRKPVEKTADNTMKDSIISIQRRLSENVHPSEGTNETSELTVCHETALHDCLNKNNSATTDTGEDTPCQANGNSDICAQKESPINVEEIKIIPARKASQTVLDLEDIDANIRCSDDKDATGSCKAVEPAAVYRMETSTGGVLGTESKAKSPHTDNVLAEQCQSDKTASRINGRHQGLPVVVDHLEGVSSVAIPANKTDSIVIKAPENSHTDVSSFTKGISTDSLTSASKHESREQHSVFVDEETVETSTVTGQDSNVRHPETPPGETDSEPFGSTGDHRPQTSTDSSHPITNACVPDGHRDRNTEAGTNFLELSRRCVKPHEEPIVIREKLAPVSFSAAPAQSTLYNIYGQAYSVGGNTPIINGTLSSCQFGLQNPFQQFQNNSSVTFPTSHGAFFTPRNNALLPGLGNIVLNGLPAENQVSVGLHSTGVKSCNANLSTSSKISPYVLVKTNGGCRPNSFQTRANDVTQQKTGEQQNASNPQISQAAMQPTITTAYQGISQSSHSSSLRVPTLDVMHEGESRKSSVNTAASCVVKPDGNTPHRATTESANSLQGLLGYINVPVVKDVKGNLVVILPNNQSLMGVTRSAVGPKARIPKSSISHKQELLQPAKVDKGIGGQESSTVNIGSTPEATGHVTCPTKEKNGSLALCTSTPKVTCHKDVSIQEQTHGLDSESRNASATVVNVSTKADPKDVLTEECSENDGSEKALMAEAMQYCNKIQQWWSRQRAIASKVKELRNVRNFLSKHGTTENGECARRINRLKQVEDLLIRRLHECTKEMTSLTKQDETTSRSVTTQEREGTEIKPQGNVSGNMTVLTPTGNNSTRMRDGASVESEGIPEKKPVTPAKESDVKRKQQPLSSVKFLRNCITAMATKKQVKCSHRKDEREGLVKDISLGEDTSSHSPVSKLSMASASSEMEVNECTSSSTAESDCFMPVETTDTGSKEKLVLRLERVGKTYEKVNKTDSTREELSQVTLRGEKGDKEFNGLESFSSIFDEEINSNTAQNVTSAAMTTRNDKGVDVQIEESSRYEEPSIKDKTKSTLPRSVVEEVRETTEPVLFKNHMKSVKDKLFTGPSKERVELIDKEDRELVKDVWRRAFPGPSSTVAHSNEAKDKGDGELESRFANMHRCMKQGRRSSTVKHVNGNPIIRGNLTSIGNINITKSVGSSAAVKFQRLLKQLQKQRKGATSTKRSMRGGERSREAGERNSDDDEPNEYVSLISRGIQASSDSLVKNPLNGIDSEGISDSVISTSDSCKERQKKKKRDRESTGSVCKPRDKIPRTGSPSCTDEQEKPFNSTETSELEDLISLREEVLSRQSNSSERTLEYDSSLISIEETVRRIKKRSDGKMKLRNTGTMTSDECHSPKQSANLSSPKLSKSTVKQFATKTRGYTKYRWCKKKSLDRTSTSRRKTWSGSRKKNSKLRKKALVKDVQKVDNDDSVQKQNSQDVSEKGNFDQKPKRRSTLASLSARLWNECYWATLNDAKCETAVSKEAHLPCNNSPPATRRTGLESKMMKLWEDLLRYTGNYSDMESLPVTAEDVEGMNLPPAVANSLMVLLEGYQQARQSSKPHESCDADSDESVYSVEGTVNERSFHDETAQTAWDERSESASVQEETPQKDGTNQILDVPNGLSFEALTPNSVETRLSHEDYQSSESTQSPPPLQAQFQSISTQKAVFNRLQWPAHRGVMHGSNDRPSSSPDYSAGTANRNNCHEEGDSARTSGGSVVDTDGAHALQINGAGDLEFQRAVSTASNPGRNRRRQDRAVTKRQNTVTESSDSDDDLPLAKYIERFKERATVLQQEIIDSSQKEMLSEDPGEIMRRSVNQRESRQSSDSELPGPFLLEGQFIDCSYLSSPDGTESRESVDIFNSGFNTCPSPNDANDGCFKQSQSNIRQTTESEEMKRDQSRCFERIEVKQKENNCAITRPGKNVYGRSKKGKSLVKKPHGTDPST